MVWNSIKNKTVHGCMVSPAHFSELPLLERTGSHCLAATGSKLSANNNLQGLGLAKGLLWGLGLGKRLFRSFNRACHGIGTGPLGWFGPNPHLWEFQTWCLPLLVLHPMWRAWRGLDLDRETREGWAMDSEVLPDMEAELLPQWWMVNPMTKSRELDHYPGVFLYWWVALH